LYNWEAAKTACPAGWHLPTEGEFRTLITSAGGTGNPSYNSLINDGYTGFIALPGGDYIAAGNRFDYIGVNALFWSSSPNLDSDACGLVISSNRAYAEIRCYERSLGCSVRCLKNN
jgi:uncharacterized protein (TIGR02145 family)